jgi:hypothetical protein
MTAYAVHCQTNFMSEEIKLDKKQTIKKKKSTTVSSGIVCNVIALKYIHHRFIGIVSLPNCVTASPLIYMHCTLIHRIDSTNKTVSFFYNLLYIIILNKCIYMFKFTFFHWHPFCLVLLTLDYVA